jgi:hypothetical protein
MVSTSWFLGVAQNVVVIVKSGCLRAAWLVSCLRATWHSLAATWLAPTISLHFWASSRGRHCLFPSGLTWGSTWWSISCHRLLHFLGGWASTGCPQFLGCLCFKELKASTHIVDGLVHVFKDELAEDWAVGGSFCLEDHDNALCGIQKLCW